jgi:hypothetical protein
LILLSDNSTKPDSDNGFVLLHIISFLTMFQPIFNALRLAIPVAFIGGLAMTHSAWAYKVEQVCQSTPASSSTPAHKNCKVVRVQEGAVAPKGDGKGSGKPDGKGDGKADGKGDAKPDAKKDAKP